MEGNACILAGYLSSAHVAAVKIHNLIRIKSNVSQLGAFKIVAAI
jgi:hypothetical protein